MRLVHIGFQNYVNADRVLALIQPNSSPVRRIRERAFEDNKLVDATKGRKTRSILIMDSGHIVLSGIGHESMLPRFREVKDGD